MPVSADGRLVLLGEEALLTPRVGALPARAVRRQALGRTPLRLIQRR
jgi:hypothetical protein